jgi:WD40 repeat protein
VDAHSDVNAAVYHSSGAVLVTAGNDRCVKLWDTTNSDGPPVHFRTLENTASSVLCVAVSIRKDLIVGGCAGGTVSDYNVYLWDDKGKRLHTLSGHVDKIVSVTFADEHTVVSGSWDRTLKFFNVESGFCENSVNCGSKVNSISMGATPFSLWTSHFDKSLRLWDIQNFICTKKIAVDFEVNSVVLSPDSNYILANTREASLRIYDIRTMSELKTFRQDNYKNTLARNMPCFSWDGKYVAVGSTSKINSENCILAWNVNTGKLETNLKFDAGGPIPCVGWHPYRSQLFACNGKLLSFFEPAVK